MHYTRINLLLFLPSIISEYSSLDSTSSHQGLNIFCESDFFRVPFIIFSRADAILLLFRRLYIKVWFFAGITSFSLFFLCFDCISLQVLLLLLLDLVVDVSFKVGLFFSSSSVFCLLDPEYIQLSLLSTKFICHHYFSFSFFSPGNRSLSFSVTDKQAKNITAADFIFGCGGGRIFLTLSCFHKFLCS